MADRLFAATDLSPPSLRVIADQIGLDLERYDRDLNDPALEQQLNETTRWATATNLGGLPQVWMQNIVLIGAQTPDSLNAGLNRLLRLRSGSNGRSVMVGQASSCRTGSCLPGSLR